MLLKTLKFLLLMPIASLIAVGVGIIWAVIIQYFLDKWD